MNRKELNTYGVGELPVCREMMRKRLEIDRTWRLSHQKGIVDIYMMEDKTLLYIYNTIYISIYLYRERERERERGRKIAYRRYTSRPPPVPFPPRS